MTISLLILLVAGFVSLSSAACNFDNFLYTNSSDEEDFWHLADRYDGTYLSVRFGEKEGRISYLPLNSTKVIDSYAHCLAEVEHYRVINIKTTRKNFTLCLLFHQRTPNVVTLSYKNAELVNQTQWSCGTTPPENMPIFLTANKPRAAIPGICSMKGSFIFTSTSHPLNETLCKDVVAPSVLESECVHGDGLHLYFASNLCIPPNTGWSLSQRLHCLDEWHDTEFRYTYTLLGEYYYQPRWCMRFHHDTKTLQIFQDLACVASKSTAMFSQGVHYITMTVKKMTAEPCKDEPEDVLGSLCYPQHCHIESYRRVCRHVCNICHDKSTYCKYADLTGNWLQMEDSGFRGSVEVKDNTFHITNYTSFQCLQELWPRHYLSQVTVHSGCAAQFTCVRTLPLSSAIGAYQFSRKVHEYTDEKSVCYDDMIEDGRWPLENLFMSRIPKNIIKETLQPADLLPCSLGGFYEVSGIGGSGAHFKGFVTDITENCTAVSHGGIAIELNGLRYSDMYCLLPSRSTFHNFKIQIMSNANVTAATCVVIRGWNSETLEMSALSSPQCSWGTRDEILSGQRSFAIRVNGTKVNNWCATSSPATTSPTEDYTTSEFNMTTTTTTSPPASRSSRPAMVAAIFLAIVLTIVLLAIAGYCVHKGYRRRHPYRVL